MKNASILPNFNPEKIISSGSDENVFFEYFIGPAAFFHYIDGHLSLIKVNKKYLSEVGLDMTSEEYLKLSPEGFLDEQDYAAYLRVIQKAAETKEQQTVITKRKIFSQCCGVDFIFIKSDIQLVAEKDGKYTFYATIRNITAEKNKLDDIAESEEKFRLAAEQANVYAWEYTIATKEMRPCVRCMRDLGLPALVENYPEPAIEGGIFPPDYADMYRDWMRQIDAGIPSIEGIIPLTPNRIPFYVRYTTEFGIDGKPLRAFGSATLVIDSEKEAEYQEIVNTLSRDYMDVISVDLENDKCKIIKSDGCFFDKAEIISDEDYEYTFSSQVQKFVSSKVCPCDMEMIRDALQRSEVSKALEASGEYSKTYRIKEAGITHYYQFRFFRLAGRPTIVCVFQNVDEAVDEHRKQAEILENALDTAKRANAAKTMFLSHMSHDIRTPLNGIIGLIEMEERHPDDLSMLATNRTKMKVAANHLLALINDVLDLSKMEDENTVLAKEPFDMRTIYADVLSIAGLRASEDGITLSRVDTAKAFGNPYVYGSPLHVRKVLLNIINNSIKYNKPNGSVSCEIESKTQNGKVYYQFTVSDTGIGMSEEFQKRMFEPFSQERADARSIFQGTGLGMSIVKALIDKMGGDIKVKSILNVGSTFIITIPFDIADESEIAGETDAPKEVSLEGVKILLAEDNELNAEIATMLLEDAGAEITLVTDGQQAVDAVVNNAVGSFDIVLMDVMMPVMDGLEATKQIRKMNRVDALCLPIIAMTANAFADDIKTCKDAGMNAHIAKPLNVSAAMATIAEFIK